MIGTGTQNQSIDSVTFAQNSIDHPSGAFPKGRTAQLNSRMPGIILLTCEQASAGSVPRKSIQSRRVSAAQYQPYMKYRNIKRSKERLRETKHPADFENLDLLLKTGLY